MKSGHVNAVVFSTFMEGIPYLISKAKFQSAMSLVDVACFSSINTESAGLLQSSHSSVVRASTAKVRGLGFDF